MSDEQVEDAAVLIKVQEKLETALWVELDCDTAESPPPTPTAAGRSRQ